MRGGRAALVVKVVAYAHEDERALVAPTLVEPAARSVRDRVVRVLVEFVGKGIEVGVDECRVRVGVELGRDEACERGSPRVASVVVVVAAVPRGKGGGGGRGGRSGGEGGW